MHTLYIVRHGDKLKKAPQPTLYENVWSAPKVSQGDPFLSPHGEDQAQDLGRWFATLPESERPQAIYVSPLIRTLQTATPVALELALPIEVEHGLSEWLYPVKHGRHPHLLHPTTLATFFPLVQPTPSLLQPPGKGETSIEFHARARTLVDRLLDRCRGVDTAVLVTHAATAIALGRALTREPEKEIRAGTASVGMYVRSESGAWEQRMNGATFMLERGEERHWDFSHVVECVEEYGELEDDTDEPFMADLYGEPPSADLLFSPPEGLLAQ